MRTNSIEKFKTGSRPIFLSNSAKTADVEVITTRKEKPEFDITREINNRTFIRPLPPKGHIVKTGILNAPLNYFDDVKTDINALKSAWNGKANDHQLGKLNDLGMKIGGLAIAGYLFSMRQTPITKIMEFIGLGSFFASMAIWPKIALDIPAKIIHGFSPFMMYEDSQGRKKRFFTDNQYIPFDMLSHKDINRIGNKLGVSKNQVNYREAVQEKMRQIALQNNTMWMLTAGFATPIMSALICNFCEPYVEKVYNAHLNKKTNKIIENFSDYTSKYKNNNINESINQIIASNDNKPITKELLSRIANVLSGTLGSKVQQCIEKDLNEKLIDGNYKIPDTHLNAIQTRIANILENEGKKILPLNTIKEITPTEDQLNKILTEKLYFNKPLTKEEIQDLIRDISALLHKNIDLYNNTATGETKISQYKQVRLSEFLRKSSTLKTTHTLEDILTKRPAQIFDGSAQSIIRDLAKTFTNINAEHNALNAVTFKKLAFAPNTEKAYVWNSAIASITKTLNITQKEIDMTHYDRKLVGELINKKVWQLATSSKEEYSNFIKKLAHDISQIEAVIKPMDKNSSLFKQIQTTYETAAANLRNMGFAHTADSFARADKKEVGTLIGASKSFIYNSLTNLASTFSSILNKANMYRTLYKDPNLSFIDGEALPKEVKEEIVGLIEYLTTEGRISDYSVKFDFLRNLTPDKTVGSLDIKPNSGIKYAFYDAEKRAADGVLIKTDISFFRRVMSALFKTPIDSETNAALSEYSFVSRILKKYRTNMVDFVANLENFMYPEHVMEVHKNGGSIDKAATYTSATPKIRSNTVGAALDETFTNILKQKYNTNKWLKLFGGIGIGLYGLTVLSQFLFGRGNSNKVKKGEV